MSESQHGTEICDIISGKRYSSHFQDGSRGRGECSEVWNRVYMIAPGKKFGRVRLSTISLQSKYGAECKHGRTVSFCSVLSFSRF